jgi:hypothetical protein
MTSHLHRLLLITVVRMWWGRAGGRRHHHLIRDGMLHLWALVVIVWVCVSRNRRRGHGRTLRSVRWRRIRSRRRHVCLRRRHLAHGRRIHAIWRRHTRRIRHRLHEVSRHVSTRRAGRHSGHHWLSRVTVRRISVDVSPGGGLSSSLGSGVLLVRLGRHRR